jgi:hypothetical protein
VSSVHHRKYGLAPSIARSEEVGGNRVDVVAFVEAMASVDD